MAISEEHLPRNVQAQAASFVAMAEHMGGNTPWTPVTGEQAEGGAYVHVEFVHRCTGEKV